MSERFRIGLSPALDPARGPLRFPSYDLSALANDPAFDIAYFEGTKTLAAADLGGFDALVLLGERMAASSFPGDDRLALIARMGVGYDTVDLAACTDHGVALSITPPSVARPMAIATLTLLLSLATNLLVKDGLTRQGPAGWAEKTQHHGIGPAGRTLGLVGLGNIGREVLALVRPLEMRVIVHDPALSAADAVDLGVELCALDDVFRRADFVSLHCPLTEETHHLVNARRLALMKPEAFLINTARGPIVDQAALVHALEEGLLAGAGLDVFEPEPLAADDPISRLDNVVLTPHALGFSDLMFGSMAEIHIAAFRAVAAGRPPAHVVNREVLDKTSFAAKLARYDGA